MTLETIIRWHTHPSDGYQRYCSRCWPAVKQELEGEDDL